LSSVDYRKEEQLISLLKQGDQKGLQILYDDYSQALYGIILRIVRSEDTASDLLQETFVKIWSKFSFYNNGKGRLFTWMVNIARNTAIDHLRSKDFKLSQKVQPTENFVDETGVSMKVEEIGIREMVEKHLSKENHSIIELIYYKGFTQKEVADKLDMPLGTVKSKVRIACRELRKVFN